MRALFGICVLGIQCVTVQAGAPAQPIQWTKVSVQIPFGDTDFPAGDGSATAEGYCLMCHSAGTVLRQPPLTEAQWDAEIQKMRTSFGAPVPPEQDAALVKYLLSINNPAAKPAATNK